MKDYIFYSDEELMQEIKADNMFAFDVLYNKYKKRLYKFGYSILKSQEETENFIQDVFLTLWETRYKLRKTHQLNTIYLQSLITQQSLLSGRRPGNLSLLNI